VVGGLQDGRCEEALQRLRPVVAPTRAGPELHLAGVAVSSTNLEVALTGLGVVVGKGVSAPTDRRGGCRDRPTPTATHQVPGEIADGQDSGAHD